MVNKYYGIRDNWTDDDLSNVIDITSEDGVITEVNVNGEPFGGGGGLEVTYCQATVTLSGYASVQWITINDNVVSFGGADTSGTYTIPLFNGVVDIYPWYQNPPTISGNITSRGNGMYRVTGDFSISIS